MHHFSLKEYLGWNIGQTEFRGDKAPPLQLYTGLKFAPVFLLMGVGGHHI